MDKPIAKLKLLTTKGEVVDAILYCHQETTTIAGTTYYLLKLNTPADASGTTLSASTASVARVVWGKFVYPLTGIAKILASTIYATYRAYTGGGTVNAEIDILIRQADGTVRTTIATGVSKSANLGTAWATYTGADYSFADYTVVDQTDYLEIDYIANVTAKKATQYAYLRIDDNTLDLADQTRSQEWKFTGVTTLSAINVTYNSATLNGQINGTETMTIRGFEWGTQSGNYTDSWTESGAFPPDTFSYNLTNLSPGTTYYFRAKAYSDASGWIYGNELSFTTLTPIVTTRPATNITLTSATLNGETANFTATIRGFDWGKQSGNYTDSWTEEGSFPPSTFTHTITGLDQDTTYYFRAKAYCPDVGWIYGDELSFHTLAPAIVAMSFPMLYIVEFPEEAIVNVDNVDVGVLNQPIVGATGKVYVDNVECGNFTIESESGTVYIDTTEVGTYSNFVWKRTKMLISKIPANPISHVAKDFPEVLVKSGKAQDLRSKIT
jgi:hypothetical protein